MARNDVIGGRVSSSHYEIKRVANKDDPSLDEAHALASIDDPHVSTGVEIAPTESRPSLIVIERPQGETLEHRGTLLPSRAVHVAIQIAHALHAAHVAGVIHRNVRPANVTLVQTAVDDAFVKLTGFGRASSHKKKERDRFVPPEGNTKKVSGVHTDVFGVGACLDAMLGPSRRRDPALARIVAKATADDPKARYESAAELESALRAWSTAEPKSERNTAWYALGALVAIGIGMIATNQHSPSPASAPSPIVREAHAAIVPSAPAPVAAAKPNEDVLEIGPPPLDSISAPPIAPPTEPAAEPAAGGAATNVVPVAAKVASTYVPPSGSFYVDEPLRYVSARDGEAWRVSTTKKVSECVDRIGTGDCELNAMELHCTIDRHGVMHCSRLTPRNKAGKACEVPPALDDCIGRAAAGVFTPKFDRGDVQLAEMKYWIRRAH